MPSGTVADVLTASHRKWLATPGKKGQPHKDGAMRRLLPDYTKIFGAADNPYPQSWLEEYRNAWHLLRLETSVVEAEAD